jgi:hypothetical protein
MSLFQDPLEAWVGANLSPTPFLSDRWLLFFKLVNMYNMKRAVSNSHGNGDERPAKLQRRDSPSTVPIPSNRQQEEQITAQPLSPLSNNINTKVSYKYLLR